MPDNITLEQLSTAQNTHFAVQTADMNELKENTAALLSALSELANRVYGYSHEALATETLDAAYDGIVEENSELAELSAVGFTALLKTGDSIYTQGNICYINGELCEGLTSDGEAGYTFTGENGAELVSVWYFENSGALDLTDDVNFNIIEISILKQSALPVIDSSYTRFTTEAKTEKFQLSTAFNGKILIENGTGERSSVSASNNLVEYYSDLTQLDRNVTGFANNTMLKRVNLPECVYFGVRDISRPAFDNTDTNSTMFMGCSNPQFELMFPKVEYILGSASNISGGIFDSMYKVKIPSSAKYITGCLCSNNTIIELECTDAVSISNTWCKSAPAIFRMADDWGASINIAVAAASWSKAQFVDLFENTLRDMDDEVREIKIPSDIYDSLTDEEFALAEDKNWTVGA